MLIALALHAGGAKKPESGAGEARADFRQIRLGLAHIGRAGMAGDLAAIQWLGSGFLVDDRCTVVTAAHLIEGESPDGLVVRFLDPERSDTVRTHSARVLYRAPDKDLLMLRFGGERNAKRICGSDTLRPLPLADEAAIPTLTGEPVLIAGFPALEAQAARDVPIVKRGSVASSELAWEGRPMLLLDLTGVPGFSGSPVILERSGVVIGFVYGPGRTHRLYDLEWAVPLTRQDYDRGLEESGSR